MPRVAVLLFLLSLLLVVVVIDSRTVPEAKRVCRLDQKTYRDGESFDYNCAARCTCEDGQLVCVDLCPSFQYPPECKLVRKTTECCPELQCP